MNTRADATRAQPAPLPEEVDEDLDAEGLPADDFDADVPEDEAADSLADETGIDLTDASELDADNVPADEEFDRVVNAPD